MTDAPREDRSSPEGYRALDATQIVETLELLERRIEDRFPGRGLTRVAAELVAIARNAKVRAEEFARPSTSIRWLGWGLAVGTVLATAAVFFFGRPPDHVFDFGELIQVLEAGLNAVVLIGAAVFFLATLERRVKRGRALRAIHELRALAHIIDMHQLTKDPERVLPGYVKTRSSPDEQMTAFELNRYFDYCTELLSLAGKIAALYVQRFDDEVALAAVNEVEDLCTGLSQKIWQKLVVVGALPGLSGQVEPVSDAGRSPPADT